MQLQDLNTSYARKSKKRVGRGGKRGTFSGKGQKGQRARSGHRIRPASRDLFMRIPKLRGIKHKSIAKKARVISVHDLEAVANAHKGSPITKELLVSVGVAKASGPVKILGDGEIHSAITIQGILVSKSARVKIEKAGGTIKS